MPPACVCGNDVARVRLGLIQSGIEILRHLLSKQKKRQLPPPQCRGPISQFRGGSLTVHKGDDFAGPSPNFPQRVSDALRGIRDCGTSGGRDLGQTLLRLRGGLLGLGGSVRGGGRGVPDGGPSEQELRLAQRGTGRRRDGHYGRESLGRRRLGEKKDKVPGWRRERLQWRRWSGCGTDRLDPSRRKQKRPNLRFEALGTFREKPRRSSASHVIPALQPPFLQACAPCWMPGQKFYFVLYILFDLYKSSVPINKYHPRMISTIALCASTKTCLNCMHRLSTDALVVSARR